MFECTLIHKSLKSPLPKAPKKKTSKQDDDDDKKDPDAFQQPENVVNASWGEIQVSPSVPKS